MNYRRIYELFIESRRFIAHVDTYVESHHVLPRSLGGSDSPENIIDLTAEDHLFAHILLAKIYGGKMWCALNFMLSSGRYQGRRSRITYAVARKNHAASITGDKNPFFGKKHTEETKRIIRQKRADQVISPESRKKQGDSMRGRKRSKEAREKTSISLRGKSLSPERKAKISKSASGRIWITNGSENAVIKDKQIPLGWRRGITPKSLNRDTLNQQ